MPLAQYEPYSVLLSSGDQMGKRLMVQVRLEYNRNQNQMPGGGRNYCRREYEGRQDLSHKADTIDF